MELEEPRVTLYDFLYIDRDRVKSIYAQLFSGLLRAVEEVAGRTFSEESSVKGKVPPIIEGAIHASERVTESTAEKTDPHDIILTDVLNELANKKLIHGKPSEAIPGNILLLKGSLCILDFTTFRFIFDFIPYMMSLGSYSPIPPNITSKQIRKEMEKKDKETRGAVTGMVQTLANLVPNTLQIILHDGEVTAWGAIRKGNLREDPANIFMKSGPVQAGEWFMLGIVDAVGPNAGNLPENMPELISGIMKAVEGLQSSFGRPNGFIGVSPLLVFRKLLT